MKKPWETWVLRGLSINEAAPLFEKMERIQMEPWGHAFGWKSLTLPDGRKVKLTIQKNGTVAIYSASTADKKITEVFLFESGLVCADPWKAPTSGLPINWFYYDTPISIYLTDSVKEHIASQPTTQFSSGELQGKIGIAGSVLIEADNTSSASPYESQIYPVNLDLSLFPNVYNTIDLVHLRPEWESGIAVPFLQGVMGSGRAGYDSEFINKWRRKGYSYLKDGRAIIRSPKGTYFFVEEMIAYKMEVKEPFKQILNAITHGSIDSNTAAILYPMALSYLEPDLTIEYPLLEDGELDKFNPRSEFFIPPRFADWYWQWSPQLTSDAQAEAYDVKVTRTSPEDSTAVIRKAHLVVAWDTDGKPVPTTLDLIDYAFPAIDRSKIDFYYVRNNTGSFGDNYAFHSGISTTSIEWELQADIPGGLAQVLTPSEFIEPIPNYDRTPLAIYYDKSGELVEVALTLQGEWDNHIEKQDEGNPVYYQIPGPASARYYRRYSSQEYVLHIGQINTVQQSGVLTEEVNTEISWTLPSRDMCESPADLEDAGFSWDKIWLLYHIGTYTLTTARTTGKTAGNILNVAIGEPGNVWVQEDLQTYKTVSDFDSTSGPMGVYDWWYAPGGANCDAATLATKTITADYWHQYGLEVYDSRIYSVRLYSHEIEYPVNKTAENINIGGDYLVARRSANGSLIYNNVGYLVAEDNAIWSSSSDLVHPEEYKQLRVWIGGA